MGLKLYLCHNKSDPGPVFLSKVDWFNKMNNVALTKLADEEELLVAVTGCVPMKIRFFRNVATAGARHGLFDPVRVSHLRSIQPGQQI